ncbi:MAG: uroporphyrinogen decarboxylase [Deltaproteobacteria bacterium]|jgi:MtaA/CmuA family methyltransferase|nr:uroporphyrinogen decarboxylase [Deltaproteobacteria bacterium]MBT4637579.1 uroporphyrinogen decarboxylase [Deltaproteobacteria bacterium]MBT6504560.1 uroporphyrinogen decarboxylase [Deltaproteobacteria bacterium]MBT6614556.1 uroporphyrinogen decarboxylase [Deltaproteobacteria bacterium]MBT7714337.1 uroporphyrinogen decarboxylase [Deltaproteobacteria bacterium]
MNGRELVKAAIKLEDIDRIPWVPFVGCHGGFLIGVNAQAYLQSEVHIVKGTEAAIQRYKPDGIPVYFDLQVEAEILGCDLLWGDENPPAVSSHPLQNGKTIADLRVPQKTEGRLPQILSATKTLREKHPEIALYGLITGPFTLALHLFGTDIFMKMFKDASYVESLFDFCCQVSMAMSDYYLEAGCDVIAVVDPMTSQIGPDHFRQFVMEPSKQVFGHIREKGALSSFFVCGHAQQNIEVMCECGPDNVSVDENIPLDFVRDICLAQNTSFGGNLQLTVTLLLGDENDAMRNARECLEVGKNKGFLLAPGCDLPYSTPPQNLEAIADFLHSPYQQEIAKTLQAHETDQDILDMSDYGKSEKVIIDIITLDSESCAPCQYMVESVRKITPQFNNIVEWREHKIKHRESLQFMTSLMVKNIPTICIDGRITFVSRIPPGDELIAAIQKRIFEKLSHKIRTRKGSVIIMGKDEEECNQLRSLVEQATHELGESILVRTLTDPAEILSYGITSTPALVTARYKVKSEGAEPSVSVIKEWLKELQ